ncbi:hypothetical protein BU24DRAFT_449521 [Aaosphaeria arxii CBS 175.79]|uniref:EthD domain-containing protein n=1 Tax=Aaosphaeria arxii CBS 175.79 TaxID=1450172 RepID=A0A6A5XYR6_9PLEO|nr:uncharacterized protein BU24DRAFT_449521 [Aaosphaeria arxii CBS 175.79]KAF2017957.1 hypothetical protein BU24DRAFT_449521 [Aaosphaeria arxii CBS 175.79]
MTYTIVLFVSRRPNITTDQFRDFWENSHIPLLKSIAGKAFPLSHTRHYVARVNSKAGDRAGVKTASTKIAASAAPVVLVGNANEVDWDGYAELVFRDELHFQQFFALVNEPDAAERIQMDEEQFSDPDKFKIVVLGDTVSTGAD